jgi:multidrug efflux system outer membrane protein
MRRAGVAALLGLTISSCALGPDYQRPELPVPPAWRELPPGEAESLANTPWWELFRDPVLLELIRTALSENRDLKLATERLEEARIRQGFVRADALPQLTATAGAARVQPSAKGLIAAPDAPDRPLYVAQAAVSWELDIFGRVRRASEAQRALFLATAHARRGVVLALVGDVARAYVELRDFERRLEIARRTLASRLDALKVARDRFEGGLTGELDLRQAEAESHRTQSLVYGFEVAVAQKENELALLLGRSPGPLGREGGLPELSAEVPPGLPSELLERRPDICQAEELLHAATADIGQARALLFPRLALTGSYGWESTDLGDVGTRPAQAWSLAANLLQPIFQGGRNRRRIEIAESRQRQALYAYEQTVLLALREVEDSLVGHRKATEQRPSEGRRVEAERHVLELAELRYRGGVSAYLEVLDAQRSLLGAELEERRAVRDHLVSLIRVYKALGGGWVPEPAGAAAGAPAVQAPYFD